MPRSAVQLAAHRIVSAGALLAAIGLLASSCAQAIGADGYQNGFDVLCAFAARCYGSQYAGCAARVQRVSDQDESGDTAKDWLAEAAKSGCLESCAAIHNCLDFPPICYDISPLPPAPNPDSCAIDADCCGFATGVAACEDGLCCKPLGVECTDDAQCCPNAGLCDPATNTCGGARCGASGEPCLNDFQCCSGRCNDDKTCEDVPCPPEGFECATDADCCDLQCLPAGDTKRCKHPSCAQEGEPCEAAADCCGDGFKCYKGNDPNAPSGVCSKEDCTPNNSDCTGGASSDCCSGFCHPSYNLCGDCVKVAGEACSAAVPCCFGLRCDDGACATCAGAGAACADTAECCDGFTCNGSVCQPAP